MLRIEACDLEIWEQRRRSRSRQSAADGTGGGQWGACVHATRQFGNSGFDASDSRLDSCRCVSFPLC